MTARIDYAALLADMERDQERKRARGWATAGLCAVAGGIISDGLGSVLVPAILGGLAGACFAVATSLLAGGSFVLGLRRLRLWNWTFIIFWSSYLGCVALGAWWLWGT